MRRVRSFLVAIVVGNVVVAGTSSVLAADRFREFLLPQGTGPFGITVGPDGNLWFTENLARTEFARFNQGIPQKLAGYQMDRFPEDGLVFEITPAGVELFL